MIGLPRLRILRPDSTSAGTPARRAALLAALLLSCGRAPHPHILLITVDTTRADRIGAYGDERARTPAIDRLARDGLLFPRATCQVPLTLPSHCSILTGTYPPYHGVRKNGGFALDPSFDTLAEILREAGYRTGAFISSFSLNHLYGVDQGFEVYDEVSASKEFLVEGSRKGTQRMLYPERPAEETIDRAIAWLDRTKGRPVFLWVHLFDPHAPYEPPEPYAKACAGDPYRGEIAAMDSQIDRLLAAFEARSPRVVVLVGDHGEGLGGHGELTHGHLVYEETMQVPFLLAGTGLAGGPAIRPEFAETVDLVPTILALSGVRWSGPLQGRDLSRAEAAGDSLGYGETLYGKLAFGWCDLRVVRSGDWKYIRGTEPELYDLRSDPGETRDLHESEAALVARLAARLAEVLKEKPDLPESASVVEIGKEEAEALAALGYVGSARLRGKAVGLDEELGGGADPRAAAVWAVRAERLDSLFTHGEADSAVALASAIASASEAGFPLRVSATSFLILWGHYRAARDLCEGLVREAPDEADAWVNLAAACVPLGDLRAGREALDRALGLDRESPIAYFSLGRLYAAEGKPDSAIGALRESLRLDPHQVPALLLLARVAYDKKHVKDAHEAAREAVRLEPQNREARQLLFEIEQEFPELAEGASRTRG